LLTLILVAAAIGLDNLAVAIGIGVSGVNARTRLDVGLVFGIFEAGMPAIGLVLGYRLSHTVGHQGRWIGAGLLIAVGLYGLVSELRSDEAAQAVPTGRRGRLILIGFALSIDNLVIGFALGSNHLGVAECATVIGAVSVALSILGLELGDRIGTRIGERGELLGSAVLIAVGAAIAAGVL